MEEVVTKISRRFFSVRQLSMRRVEEDKQGQMSQLLHSFFALSRQHDITQPSSQSNRITTPDVMSETNGVSSGSVGVIDIGKVLLQLSSEVASAKAETEIERSLCVSLEAENQQLLDVIRKGFVEEEGAHTQGSSVISIDDTTNISLERCLKYISSLPPHMQEAVFMVYSDSSSVMVGSVILSDIRAILRPVDVPGLMFVLMSSECPVSSHNSASVSCSAASGVASIEYCDLVPFTIDNLHILLGDGGALDMMSSKDAAGYAMGVEGYYMDNQSSDSMTPFGGDYSCLGVPPPSPSAAAGLDDDSSIPRLNLIEALNVQSDDDIKRIVTVRKCHKLGFKSQLFLKQYFSKFGNVEKVVLLPMRAKPKPGGMSDNSTYSGGRNTRPSSMGFIVMSSEAAVANVLSFDNGSGVHIIKGWPIEVRNFVRPADKPGMPFSSSSPSCIQFTHSPTSPSVVAVPVSSWSTINSSSASSW